MSILRSRLFLATFVVTSAFQPVGAQQAANPADTAGAPLFTRRDAVMAAAWAGATVAMFPADRSFARRLTNERSKANRFLNGSSKGVELIADPGSLIIGAGLYAFGRFTNHPDIEDLGWHGTEAVILGSSITEIIKSLAGRARPYATGDTTAHDFKFGGGFTNADRQSFPSGHTTAAFAAAAAVTSETERIWPHHPRAPAKPPRPRNPGDERGTRSARQRRRAGLYTLSLKRTTIDRGTETLAYESTPYDND